LRVLLVLLERLSRLVWSQNSDTSVLFLCFVHTDAWLQSSATSALKWEAEAKETETGDLLQLLFASFCLRAIRAFALPVRGCDRLLRQALEDAIYYELFQSASVSSVGHRPVLDLYLLSSCLCKSQLPYFCFFFLSLLSHRFYPIKLKLMNEDLVLRH
jgi:hypothetical protein